MSTPTEPTFVTVSVTCETPGCAVEGVTYTGLSIQEHAEVPTYRVVCGQCGKSPAVILT